MSSDFPWNVLGLDGPCDSRSVRRRYAALAKVHRPDSDPEGFQRLRAAYEVALAEAVEVPGEVSLASAASGSAEVNDEAVRASPARETFPGSEQPVAPSEPPAATAPAAIADFHALDHAQQLDWRAQMNALIRASGLDVDDEPGVPILTVDPSPTSLETAVQALLAHPANEGLNAARETEYTLVNLAAHSPVWPIKLVEWVWRHYELEQRLAFVQGWHPLHHIQRRLDEEQQWSAVRQHARETPQGPQGMLFQPPSWSVRLRWWFSESMREQSVAIVDAIRERHPARMGELNAASVALLDKTVARVALLPRLGPIGLMLLIAQAILWQFQVASWWPALGNSMPNHVWFWCVLGYLGLAAAKRWWLPRAAGVAERFPVTSDALELLAMLGLVAAHAVGGTAAGAATAVGVICGAVLLTLRALHGRHAALFRLQIGRDLGGVVVLLALGLLPFGVTTVEPLMVMLPLLALVVLTHHLPHPPLVLDEKGRRFVWRSRPDRGFAARPMLVGLCLVVAFWTALVVRLGDGYESLTWSGPGAVLIYLPWLLVGWITWRGTASQTLVTIGAAGLAVGLAVVLAPDTRFGTLHLIIGFLGAFHAMLWLWRLREDRDPWPAGQVAGKAGGLGDPSRLPDSGPRINFWLVFFLLFLVVKMVLFALKD